MERRRRYIPFIFPYNLIKSVYLFPYDIFFYKRSAEIKNVKTIQTVNLSYVLYIKLQNLSRESVCFICFGRKRNHENK